jgi:hypothetical protein
MRIRPTPFEGSLTSYICPSRTATSTAPNRGRSRAAEAFGYAGAGIARTHAALRTSTPICRRTQAKACASTVSTMTVITRQRIAAGPPPRSKPIIACNSQSAPQACAASGATQMASIDLQSREMGSISTWEPSPRQQRRQQHSKALARRDHKRKTFLVASASRLTDLACGEAPNFARNRRAVFPFALRLAPMKNCFCKRKQRFHPGTRQILRKRLGPVTSQSEDQELPPVRGRKVRAKGTPGAIASSPCGSRKGGSVSFLFDVLTGPNRLRSGRAVGAAD